MCEYQNIEEVKQRYIIEEINGLLEEGWVLLDTHSSRLFGHDLAYVLGKPREEPVQEAPYHRTGYTPTMRLGCSHVPVRTGWLRPPMFSVSYEVTVTKPEPTLRKCGDIPFSECDTFSNCEECLTHVEPEPEPEPKLCLPTLDGGEDCLSEGNIETINKEAADLSLATTLFLTWHPPNVTIRLQEGWHFLTTVMDKHNDRMYILIK